MARFNTTISVTTSNHNELVDITHQVKRVVRDSGVTQGLCMVYVPHTTAGVTINENADPSVKSDILNALRHIVPDSLSYRHLEGNSPGHVKASLMGSSVTIPIRNGDLALGTWQGIFFAEFDGPRSRKADICVWE
ncbi:MAG: YjbQ family protein [Candidatus Auribacter fodinae]|uniref:YjbQ family protein n=1 Tax=Candidatus Auribacter fodinae TaxID=2093366 RepID=A0A3A4R6B0_9BACT|nr:MAG: YjbQ family protein [Candidatus Auribacter fodinae]